MYNDVLYYSEIYNACMILIPVAVVTLTQQKYQKGGHQCENGAWLGLSLTVSSTLASSGTGSGPPHSLISPLCSLSPHLKHFTVTLFNFFVFLAAL